ncbi:hypothetical protein IJT93_13095 [bacterium]|nr:hypothetical protein [bacterium]
MNRFFKYSACLAFICLMGISAAQADSIDDDFDVEPQVVPALQSEETKTQDAVLTAPAGTPSQEKSAVGNAESRQDKVYQQEQPNARNKANRQEKAVSQERERQNETPARELRSEGGASKPAEAVKSCPAAASVKKPAPAVSRIQTVKSDNNYGFLLAEPEHQKLFELYADLLLHESTEGLDKGLQNRLEALSRERPDEGESLFMTCYRAHIKAKGALTAGSGELSERLAASAKNDLSFVEDWLKKYGRRYNIHGKTEPEWIKEADATAQVILAFCDLNSLHPDKAYAETVDKLSQGLMLLLHNDSYRYPFGAHLSYVTIEGKPRTYTVPESGDNVAGAALFPDRLYAAMARASASKLLKNSDMLASAEAEGLGLLAKLALSGKIPYSFAPRPEYEVRSMMSSAVVMENLLYLKDITGKNLYGTLAGCAAADLKRYEHENSYAQFKFFTDTLLKRSGCQDWIGAEDIREPLAGTACELEDGKAVEKAFDAHDIKYPGGTDGKFVVVGRDNMFWIRFDVDREDPYYFHLDFLKSSFSGALVSIMIRIDGDKIVKVSLGGATDDPFVDSEFIDGPRILRSGPHSLGVRFSGLLMKSPAVLDSVSIEPAIGRRWIKLSSGRAVLVMHSIADKSLKTRMQELEDAENSEVGWSVFDADGKPGIKNLSSDKRHHVWFEMPGGGTAVLEWPNGAIPNLW